MAVSLLGPNGERLLDVDTSPVSASEESLHFVAPAAGTYEIKVNLGRSPSVDSKGTYEFLIKQLRNALPDDRKRAAATQAASDGDRFRDTEKRDEAIKEYEKAIELWQQLGESKEEGKALYKLGLFYGALDQNPVARNFYMQALPLMRHGTSEEQAALNVNLGISNLNAGEVYEARVNFEQALSLFQQADVPRGIAYTLGEMGRASYLLGENQEALTYYHQALAAWRDGRLTESLSKRGEGIVLDLIGRVQVSLGQNSEALANFEAARAILEESIDKRSYANTLLDLGRYHVILGAPEKALPFYDKALTVLGNDNPSGRAEVLAYVGEAQAALKLFSSAIKNLNDALLLQQALNDRAGEGDTLHKLGVTYFAAGDRAQAKVYLEKALDHWLTNKYRPGEANTRYELSRVAVAMRDLGEARAQIESAVHIIESQRARVANDRLRVSYFASVQDYYKEYVDVLMQLHERNPQERLDKLALNIHERARARALLEALEGVRTNIRNGVENAELLSAEKRLRQQLSTSADLQIRLLSNKLLPEQAEKIRSQLNSIEEQLRKIEDELKESSPKYAQLIQPRILTCSEIQADLLDEHTLLLEYMLGKERSYLWVVSTTELWSFELPGRAYIESQVKLFRELMVKRNLEPAERTKRDELAKELGTTLLSKAAPLLGNKRLVVVADELLQFVPFAALQIDTGSVEPLIARHEITHEISASTLAAIRREQVGRNPSPLGVAIIANPVFRNRGRVGQLVPSSRGVNERKGGPTGGSATAHSADKVIASATATELTPNKGTPIPPLLFSEKEARSIYDLAKPGALLLSEYKANKKNVISHDLARYRIVHFSTHALLNNDQPDWSGIVLSLVDKSGRPQDGFLQLYEIYDLRLPADLIVLSACQTAIGRDVKGEGLIGLTRGFLYAGSLRVASTLWEVDDEATAELMQQFYKKMLGPERLSPAAALREAQLALWRRRDRWSDSFYWATFVIHGEWRPITSSHPSKRSLLQQRRDGVGC